MKVSCEPNQLYQSHSCYSRRNYTGQWAISLPAPGGPPFIGRCLAFRHTYSRLVTQRRLRSKANRTCVVNDADSTFDDRAAGTGLWNSFPSVSSRFAETRFAEIRVQGQGQGQRQRFGESGFGELGFGESGLNLSIAPERLKEADLSYYRLSLKTFLFGLCVHCNM